MFPLLQQHGWESFQDPRFPWLPAMRKKVVQQPYPIYICVYESASRYSAELQLNKSSLIYTEVDEIIYVGWFETIEDALTRLLQESQQLYSRVEQEIQDVLNL